MSECTHDCSSCGESCGERANPQDFRKPANELSSIKKVIAVVSGKGGVGKSAVTCTLAAAMARRGKKVASWTRTSPGRRCPALSASASGRRAARWASTPPSLRAALS